jgi:endonuclease YncB( thermonuclease family)
MSRLPVILTLALAYPWSAAASDLMGRATVIDGDTIEINGQRIGLFGIDAPELQQTCVADGETYQCGQQAALALAERVGQQTVACEERETDRDGRIIAVCRFDGADLGAWMVSQGWALAYALYSRDYIDQEDAARIAWLGVWQGVFTPPWAWRRAQRQETPLRSQ